MCKVCDRNNAVKQDSVEVISNYLSFDRINRYVDLPMALASGNVDRINHVIDESKMKRKILDDSIEEIKNKHKKTNDRHRDCEFDLWRK